MRPWLARLSFSFFVMGCFLAWHVYQVFHGKAVNVGEPQLGFEAVAAVLSFVLGFVGVRERHGRNPDA